MDMRSGEDNLRDMERDTAKTEDTRQVNFEDETIIDPEIFEDQEFEELKQEDTNAGSQDGTTGEFVSYKIKLESENRKLSNELEAMKERILRITAEYENYRKRTAREKDGIYTDAVEDVLKNMLPVLDNLERATTVNGSVDDLKKGLEMTIRQFKDSLEKLQVEEISSDGEFDPNLHNAVMHVEDESLGKNAVVEVFQKGYKRGNKVLRYSMVKVAN
jgi:molecular chaperone GrpE